MKFELEVVKFNTMDVITASGDDCLLPDVPIDAGGNMATGGCPSGHMG